MPTFGPSTTPMQPQRPLRQRSALLGSLSVLLLASGALVACGTAEEAPSEFNPIAAPPPPPAEPDPDGDFQGGDPAQDQSEGSSLGSCASTATPVARDPGNVLLLVDRSGSMHIKLPSGDTRWQATKVGLAGLLTALPTDTNVGAMMFPQGDAPVNAYCGIDAALNDVKCSAGWPEPPGANRCAVPTYTAGVPAKPLASAQADAIKSYVAASDAEFYWGTPLAPALNAAVKAQKSSGAKGTRSIILLTDGNPTSCVDAGISNDNSYVVSAAASGSAGADGVKTYVVGVIDAARQAAKAENLSPVAVAGGTARFAGCEATNECFYAVNAASFAADIKKVFEDISLKSFDCKFSVPQPKGAATADPESLNVEVTSKGKSYVVPRDKSKKDGWDYLPGGKQLEVYGESCKKLAAGVSVKIVVGCKTVVR